MNSVNSAVGFYVLFGVYERNLFFYKYILMFFLNCVPTFITPMEQTNGKQKTRIKVAIITSVTRPHLVCTAIRSSCSFTGAAAAAIVYHGLTGRTQRRVQDE